MKYLLYLFFLIPFTVSSQYLEKIPIYEDVKRSVNLNNGNILNISAVDLDYNTADSLCQCEEYQFGKVFWVYEMDSEFNIIKEKCFKREDIDWSMNSCTPDIKSIFYLNDELVFHLMAGAEGREGGVYSGDINYYYPTNYSSIIKFDLETFEFYDQIPVPTLWRSKYRIIDKIFEVNESKLVYLSYEAPYTSDGGTISDTNSKLVSNGYQSFWMQEFDGEGTIVRKSNGNQSFVYISEIFEGNSDEVILDYKQDNKNSITLLVVSNSTDGLYSEGERYNTSLFNIEIDFSDISDIQYNVTKSQLKIPRNTNLRYKDYKVFVDNNNSFVLKLRTNSNGSNQVDQNKLHFLSKDGSYNSINLDMNYTLKFEDLIDSGELTYYLNYDTFTVDFAGNRKIRSIAFNDDNFVTLEQVVVRTYDGYNTDYFSQGIQVVKFFDYEGNILSRNFLNFFPESILESRIDIDLAAEIDHFIFPYHISDPIWGVKPFGSKILLDNFKNIQFCPGPKSSIPLYTFNILGMSDALTISENPKLEISLYPNPTNDKLFIQGLSSSSRVSIYNVLGKLVLSQTISKEIDVKQLSKGIYIIKIIDEQKETVRKFIKD